jgi:uncharacterized glyoxalase superfamily protein PhnB
MKISTIILEVSDASAAARFYADAFGDLPVQFRESEAPSSGFRGFTLSLTVAQPSTVTALVDSAVAAGATVIKPVTKSMWGYGGTVRAPDGAIWKVATTAKKDTGPATRQIDGLVLLIGADDVPASKRFYVEQGLALGKSFGSYAEFDLGDSPVKFGLYKRRALAKDAGVPEEGSGSHRIAVGGDAAFTDPDGFAWERAATRQPASA